MRVQFGGSRSFYNFFLRNWQLFGGYKRHTDIFTCSWFFFFRCKDLAYVFRMSLNSSVKRVESICTHMHVSVSYEQLQTISIR